MYHFTDKNDKDIVHIRRQLINKFINGTKEMNERFKKEGKDDRVYHFNRANKINDLYLTYLQYYNRSVGDIGNNGLDYLITGRFKQIATPESSLLDFIFLAVGVKMICYDYKNWLPKFCQKPQNSEYTTIDTSNYYLDKLPLKEQQEITKNITGRSKWKYNNISKEIYNKILDIIPVTMERKDEEYVMYDLKPYLQVLGINHIYVPDEFQKSMRDSVYNIAEVEKIEYCIIDRMVIVQVSNFAGKKDKLHIYGFSILNFLQFLDTTSVQFDKDIIVLFFPSTLSNESGVCFEMNYTTKENIVSASRESFTGIQMGWVKTEGNPNCKVETYDWCKHLDYLFYMRFFFLEKYLKYDGPIYLLDLSRVEYSYPEGEVITSLYLFRNFNGNRSIYTKYGFEEIV